jgi:hypothetical protein
MYVCNVPTHKYVLAYQGRRFSIVVKLYSVQSAPTLPKTHNKFIDLQDLMIFFFSKDCLPENIYNLFYFCHRNRLINKGGIFSLLGKSKKSTFLDYDRLQLKVGCHENLYASIKGQMRALECPVGIQCTSLCVLTQCSARVPSRCPPQGPIWVPFGVCAFFGIALGVPLWQGASGGKPFGVPSH